ncbi:HPr kinase/phosphorylase [Labrys monachus]|uniref:Serine kinase of HPr protein (Carbohydrate metabolism regulator) n=1 Tax=Labrys monachus TaxID=217067 RepID=A0ABU0FMV7_9HYPH|nr:HPr kinase/phosphatase C-terminal domain-containing protein [Labrys monachus]MDQ0395418.1 serine kinase of HPr protein (carbohydrate metabolism regulator) [Labrys monachus]
MRKPTIHATCVVVGGHGVLLRGPSRAGKSRLALHFIESAPAAGRFARLVGDDRVYVEPERGHLVAHVPDTIAGLIERRGAGIEAIAYQPSAPVALVVDILADAEFSALASDAADRIAIEGIEVAHLYVPRDFDRAVARIEAILPLLGPAAC